MLNPTKTAAAAALLGLIGSPLAAQIMHEGMTCTEFQQSTPEVQTEVVDAFLVEVEEAAGTDMTNEEIVSTILNSCADAAEEDTAISKFREAVAG